MASLCTFFQISAVRYLGGSTIFYPCQGLRTSLVDLAAFKKLYAFISANFWPIRSEVEKEELIKTTTFIELLLAARRRHWTSVEGAKCLYCQREGDRASGGINAQKISVKWWAERGRADDQQEGGLGRSPVL